MADGDVCVAQVGDDWVVAIDGPRGGRLTYESLRDAVEAGRRAALSAGAKFTLDLGARSGLSSREGRTVGAPG